MFGREEELKRFSDALSFSPIIVIVGQRRAGKTSLMNVALDETEQPYLMVDFRGLSYNPSRADILRSFTAGFARAKGRSWDSLVEALRGVTGVSVAGSGVTLSWGADRVDLAELFDKIDGWAAKKGARFLAAFDETQIIRGDKEIPNLFAHVADTNRNVTLVLTGSEIGLLYDFLGFENPAAPLYARHHTDIELHRFNESLSMKFLADGFAQIGVKPSEKVLEYAVEKLDGIVGWLTLFGARCRDSKACSNGSVDETLEMAGRQARQEALKLATLSHRYCMALNYLATVEKASWTDIKGRLEAAEGHSLTNATISGTVSGLIKMTFAEKADESYRISDPVLREGLKNNPLPENK